MHHPFQQRSPAQWPLLRLVTRLPSIVLGTAGLWFVYGLEPIAPGVETLARLADYADQDWGPTMTAFENALGGRVVVMGYYPWTLLHNLAKSSQLKAVCRLLSRDTLPAIAESYAHTVVWARAGVDGRLAVVVLNASLDPATDFVLRVQSTEPDGGAHVRVTIA